MCKAITSFVRDSKNEEQILSSSIKDLGQSERALPAASDRFDVVEQQQLICTRTRGVMSRSRPVNGVRHLIPGERGDNWQRRKQTGHLHRLLIPRRFLRFVAGEQPHWYGGLGLAVAAPRNREAVLLPQTESV